MIIYDLVSNFILLGKQTQDIILVKCSSSLLFRSGLILIISNPFSYGMLQIVDINQYYNYYNNEMLKLNNKFKADYQPHGQ